MKTWVYYAFVVGDKVMNICPFSAGANTPEPKDYARLAFGDDCQYIDVSNIHASFGDTYRDGAFYYTDEEGVEHKREEVPSEEDRIEAVESSTASNTSSIESNTTAIDDILVMLLDDTSTTEG